MKSSTRHGSMRFQISHKTKRKWWCWGWISDRGVVQLLGYLHSSIAQKATRSRFILSSYTCPSASVYVIYGAFDGTVVVVAFRLSSDGSGGGSPAYFKSSSSIEWSSPTSFALTYTDRSVEWFVVVIARKRQRWTNPRQLNAGRRSGRQIRKDRGVQRRVPRRKGS